ncbi:nitrate/sulfonate/bicarbonate ABC transporter ATP-binding protein [Bifidobacterium sp. ESL0790]|uniref:ABC transporter ATP-binding protein n=1 Tax=Bifidobacterium sp. ESL0790 TaxID=2983233 RepID=UPI0023F76C3A|nr:nitrate/sulfonate/bicarbonate ABC transporter ATP-binding protein [Bifidobacterium sp. ESL0790]WEV72222.1 nitrate/sulfonate/bicarbonate ABC transporter ATP-binding protein [Bifidobacterium sp. ESL0790]
MNFTKLLNAVASETQTGGATATATRTRGRRRTNPNFADLDANATHTVIEASHISQRFTSEKGHETTVLDDISFNLHEGEIVAVLGRSGAGKSTFLRILAGLVEPSSGQVSYRGKALDGPNPGVALVFQTFALMPWLTVQDNVELGLEAKGMPRAKRHELALSAIDAIGLDGFESAYPKELSGGMRQRVGIARALVLRPNALFMDEPFSALDVLTAENLRQEVLNLWNGKGNDIKSILIVTHNIEEAVQMADRVVVLGSHPGHLIAQVPVDLPRPRDKHSPEFEAMVDRLYAILTGKDESQKSKMENTKPRNSNESDSVSSTFVTANSGADDKNDDRDDISGIADKKDSATAPTAGNAKTAASDGSNETGDSAENGRTAEVATETTPQNIPTEDSPDKRLLPNATPGGLAGLLDVVSNYPAGVDLADLAADLSFEVDDLFPLIDAGTMLGLLTVSNGHCTITREGERWCHADVLDAKQLFAQLVMDHAPLVRTIDRALRNHPDKGLRGELILDLLRSQHTDEEAQQQFDIAVTWGRYGELFDYDADDDLLTLDEANK